MPSNQQSARRRLRLVLPGQELSGNFPRGFEIAAKSAKTGSPEHRALIFCLTTVARQTIDRCVAPSARNSAEQGLNCARAWAKDKASLREVRDARSRVFEHAPRAEMDTVSSLGKALTSQSAGTADPLAKHQLEVATRYVALGVHHCYGAVALCLDAVTDPAQSLEVAGETAGAMAYTQTGLGAARSEALRSSAAEQARWEYERVASSGRHSQDGIALQRFHEYLGVHWKNHVDAQRLYFEEFLSWVFPQAAS